MATVNFHDVPVNTCGELPEIGTKAPDFSLTDSNLNEINLDQFAGKIKVLNIVPSLDTPVCAESTRKFNELVTKHFGAVVLTISADLPFAQARFCSAENIENVIPLSLIRSKDFAIDYGVLMTNGPLEGLCARAVLVLDEDNTVVHTQLIDEITHEPDYHEALSALQKLN